MKITVNKFFGKTWGFNIMIYENKQIHFIPNFNQVDYGCIFISKIQADNFVKDFLCYE